MADPTPHPADFLPLHPLELRILLTLLNGPAHGYRIVKEIEERERTLTAIYPGNLYRRIRDLLSKGLVEDADPPADGDTDPRRRYFRPTALGEAVVRAEAHRLQGLVREARAAGVLSRG